MPKAALVLPISRERSSIKNKKGCEKERNVIGQYRLYFAASGSKPISPIATTIPMRHMLNFVTLNDIRFLLVWQLLLLFSVFSFRN